MSEKKTKTSQDEMNALLAALKKWEKKLKKHKGVFKVDVGYKWEQGKMTDEIAIRVHVKDKKPEVQLETVDIVPKTIEGFPVDVIESHIELHVPSNNTSEDHRSPLPKATVRKRPSSSKTSTGQSKKKLQNDIEKIASSPKQNESSSLSERRRQHNPLVGGISIRNMDEKIGNGTLGCIVFDKKTKKPMVLTNRHVLVSKKHSMTHRVTQPGTIDLKDIIGNVGRVSSQYDCGLVRLNDFREKSGTIIDYPGGVKGFLMPVLGMLVSKSGLGTGTTFGIVEGVSNEEFTVVPRRDFPNDEISGPGDSGSIWLDPKSHAAIGLHYGGEASDDPNNERAWVKRIEKVADVLGIDLFRKKTLGETCDVRPAMTFRENILLLSWIDRESHKLHFRSTNDGFNYSSNISLSETSSDTPSLAYFKDRFILCWIGTGNNKINFLDSRDGKSWSNKVTLSDVSSSSSSLCVFKNQLYVCWIGIGNNEINIMRSSNGRNWKDKQTLQETSSAAPSITVHGNHLYVSWRGSGNNRLNIVRSHDGLSFRDKKTLNETTETRPYLHHHKGMLYLSWKGIGNHRINILKSSDGLNFRNKITLQDRCIDSPVLATLGNDFVIAWTGTDTKQKLNILLYNIS